MPFGFNPSGSGVGPALLGDHLASAAGLWEPQRQNNFIFQIGGLKPDGARKIQLAVESAALPAVGVGEVELPYMNVSRYVAGKARYDTIPLVLKDMVDVGVAAAVRDWFTLVYNPFTDQVGQAKYYKRIGSLILFAPDGSFRRVWNLLGCWPMAVNFGTLDYNAEDKVTIEVTLRYDKAISLF